MIEAPIKVLLVEDNPAHAFLLRELLAAQPGVVLALTHAENLEAAFSRLDEGDFDVLLLDLSLPESVGLETLHCVLPRARYLPVIVMTSHDDKQIAIQALQQGAQDFLVKGQAEGAAIVRAIHHALVRHQRRTEVAHYRASIPPRAAPCRSGIELTARIATRDDLERSVAERTAALARSNQALQAEVADRKRAEVALQKAHDDLEKRVQERTVALSVINDLLQLEVDQRKHSEQVLRESEARHRALLDAIPDAMITISRKGIVREYKAPREGILPQTPGRYLNRPLAEVLPEGLGRRVMDHVGKALQTGQRQVFEFQQPGHHEAHDLEARIVVSGEDETLCILRNITDRKNTERIKTEFLSVVSHELRTPLTSISGSLALMAAGVTGALPEQADAMIGIAHRNSKRLVRLINDLLDLQKIESGTMPLKLEPVEVLPLVEQVLEANYAYGCRYGVTFSLDKDEPDLWVHADADRLMQVLTNLLSNAAKFSPAESTVVVAVARHGGVVRVSVADRGPGIPEDCHALIFQKFAQVDASSSRQKEGTGLGLSISKAIVEMHGGRIAFDTVPGQGSTFYFDLPEWHEEGVEV